MDAWSLLQAIERRTASLAESILIQKSLEPCRPITAPLVIVFSLGRPGPLMRVFASGGEPVPVEPATRG